MIAPQTLESGFVGEEGYIFFVKKRRASTGGFSRRKSAATIWYDNSSIITARTPGNTAHIL